MRPVLLALVLAAAGCVAPGADPLAPAGAPQALPFPDPMGQQHDHADAALHAQAWRFEQTAHDALAGDALHSSGAHALDLRGDWLFAASYGATADANGGLFVFDAKQPEAPKLVGRYRFPGNLGGDRSMEATEDAAFVVLGTEAVDCAGHVNPFAPGLYLIDVRDKALPKAAAYVPSTGVHSVTVHRIGGDDYVFAATGGENVFKIVRSPVPSLERVAELPIGHDSVVMDDPLLAQPLLYSANGGSGFEIWDVSKPGAPEVLAQWNVPGVSKDDQPYLHTGAVRVIDGHRILVVTTEDWEDEPSRVFVLDTTDLGDIQTLSNWTAPGEHGADRLRYSMHNPRFFGDSLVLAYYHGGVWSLDLSTPASWLAPQVDGQFMPAATNGWKPEPALNPLCNFPLGDAPMVFDVEAGNGVVYVADLHTGLYVIKPTG